MAKPLLPQPATGPQSLGTSYGWQRMSTYANPVLARSFCSSNPGLQADFLHPFAIGDQRRIAPGNPLHPAAWIVVTESAHIDPALAGTFPDRTEWRPSVLAAPWTGLRGVAEIAQKRPEGLEAGQSGAPGVIPISGHGLPQRLGLMPNPVSSRTEAAVQATIGHKFKSVHQVTSSGRGPEPIPRIPRHPHRPRKSLWWPGSEKAREMASRTQRSRRLGMVDA